MATQSATMDRVRDEIREPHRYHVVMHNDDFTTMEFVVEILISIFHKDALTAEKLMMRVHKEGKAVVGTYAYDIAVTKVNAATVRAKAEGFPFRMTIEEA